MFKSLVKAAIGTVLLPVAAVVDIATLGDLGERPTTHTQDYLEAIGKNIKDAIEQEKQP